MSTAEHREPTNDELWSQPPAPATPHPGALAPVQPTPVPAASPPPAPVPARAGARGPDWAGFILAIVSLVLAIPLTGIAASSVGVPGMVFTWLGIVGVNFAYNFRQR